MLPSVYSEFPDYYACVPKASRKTLVLSNLPTRLCLRACLPREKGGEEAVELTVGGGALFFLHSNPR